MDQDLDQSGGAQAAASPERGRGPAPLAAGDLHRLISGAGHLSDIESMGALKNVERVKLLTEGLRMTMDLNMISSDSEGQQE